MNTRNFLAVCPHCGCHAKIVDPICPCCGTTIRCSTNGVSAIAAALVALGLTVGCSSEVRGGGGGDGGADPNDLVTMGPGGDELVSVGGMQNQAAGYTAAAAGLGPSGNSSSAGYGVGDGGAGGDGAGGEGGLRGDGGGGHGGSGLGGDGLGGSGGVPDGTGGR